MGGVIAAWLERPTARVGLDNLGAQQPCIAIYSRLFPGITNVTDRATYFGLYPWFIRNFARRYPDASQVTFRDGLRRADCLVTLVAERHALKLADNDASLHGATCPGRQKLGPAAIAVSAGEPLKLSTYADRSEENLKRYFKNPLGGLGQYYLGVLRDEHHILFGDTSSGVDFTIEHGEPLADLYADGLDEDRFFRTLEKDDINSADLDDLAEFCPCALHGGGRQIAQMALIELILDDSSPNGLRRANSLGLLLSFLDTWGGHATADPVKDFLTACYTGAFAGEEWIISAAAQEAQVGWALYLRNEMMSLAWSALFKASLDELDGPPKAIFDVRRIADWLLATASFRYRPGANFESSVANDREAAPPLEDHGDPNHEIQFWRELTDGDGSRNVELAVRILTRLVARYGEEDNSYASVRLPPDYLAGYPLTLNTLRNFAAGRWRSLSAEDWMRSLIVEVLVAHQRVAIRKLGLSGEDTLMFRCGDEGVVVQRRLDDVVETQPRLRQGLQILRDLGLIRPSSVGTLPVLTPLGLEQLRKLQL